jgi:hypothetical protein
MLKTLVDGIGLEAELRKFWEEFFELGEWLINAGGEVNFNFYKLEKKLLLHYELEEAKEYYEKLEELKPPKGWSDEYEDEEYERLRFEVLTNYVDLDWFEKIVKLVALLRLDALFVKQTKVKKVVKGKVKEYNYLQWLGVLAGEKHLSPLVYEVKRKEEDKDEEDKKPSEWKIHRRMVSLGYVKYTGENYDKMQHFRTLFYLYKLKFQEITQMEELFYILRKKNKRLPYRKWLEGKYWKLAKDICSLKALYWKELGENVPWWEVERICS